ncbi:hypothetical protein ATI61_101821 [Archangium gephyra]|uniref:Uncharacterized protein n=1 Tax=Archangium gephyra TaxID=48 RepID=A0AAC8QAW2_9BACT|nr:hypothetical protein [Archangium gephyra]AKJ04084.1 Hypothetical protein AA314_05710 [Archangium gephyra]REG37834.1 hypothetical protein ATI61_101821 [Archangium gephyra]
MRTAFQEELKPELTLTIGGQSFSIPGGQVKHLSVRLASHGFNASVTFWTSLEKKDAPLFTAFQKPDLVQVRLAVAAVNPALDSPPAPLVVQGIARSRRLIAEPHGKDKKAERVFRRYTFEFADAAQVLWRQHRPVELHTDMSMQEVLEAHKATLQLSYDWAALRQKQEMLCLAVGADAPEVSFYDFVLWYVHAHNGVFSYDCQKNEYLLADSKPSGTAEPLDRLQVRHVDVRLPQPIRHGTRVLNALANGPTTTPIEQPQAVAGVSHDVLLRTPITAQAEQRQKLEKARLQVRQRQLQLSFKHFPTVPVHAGALVRLEGPLWPAALTGLDEDQRVLELELEAHAEREGQHDNQQTPQANYQVMMSARLESASEPLVTLPAYRAPRYPIHVEALVHSPGGEPPDRRYLIVEDEKTSLAYFRMTVPLWNQTVSVPAEPIHFPGQFFFPPYKNTRVLIALHFAHAEFDRFLDWKEGVRTPQDGQGDQILLGWNKTSQTAFTHDFQEDKPVWRMLRTNGGDTQIVRMKEGNLFIQVKESEASGPPTPTYDVTPQVEAAKGDLTAAVGGAVGETSAAYQAAMGSVRAKMKSAQAEAKAALTGARTEVGAKVAEAKSGLKGATSRLSQGMGQLSGAAEAAKAALKKLL